MEASQSTQTQLRLLIIDPHGLIFDDLRAQLGAMPDLQLIAETTTWTAAQAYCTGHQIDVALVLSNWSDSKTLGRIQALVHQAPELRLVVLNIHMTDLRVAAAFAAGARGYMNQESLRDLPHILRLVAEGGVACCSSSGNELARRIVQTRALSPRERLIAAQVAAGQTNSEIASTLGLKTATIDTHVERILRKIGGRTRVDIATWWLQHVGLSDEEGEPQL